MFNSESSVSAVATRVTARTFEYDSRPSPNACAIFGSDVNARATRTFSLAAPALMPHCQFSQDFRSLMQQQSAAVGSDVASGKARFRTASFAQLARYAG